MEKYLLQSFILSIFFFTFIYYIIGENHIQYENKSNKIINNLYFSIVTQTLLGDPEMRPKSTLAKIIVSLQAFSTFIFLYFPIYLYTK